MYLNLTPKWELHKYNIKYVHGTWLRLTDSTEHEPTAGQQMTKTADINLRKTTWLLSIS